MKGGSACLVSFVLAVAAACGSKSAGPAVKAPKPKPVARVHPTDVLWKLAPPFAAIGAVATGEAVTQIAAAIDAGGRSTSGTPQIQNIFDMLAYFQRRMIGGVADFAAAGIDPGGDVAWFATAEGHFVVVVPVVDRAAFVASHGSTRDGEVDRLGSLVCKPIGDRYACADSLDHLVLGGGTLGASAGIDGRRGNIELVIEPTRMPPQRPDASLRLTGAIRAIAELVRGSLVLRIDIPGTPAPKLGLDALPRIALDPARTGGFVVMPISGFTATVPPDVEVAGVRAVEVLRAIEDPLVAKLPAGRGALVIDQGVRAPEPIKALIAQCVNAATVAPQVVRRRADGGCSIGPLPGFGGTIELSLDAKLHVTVTGAGESTAPRVDVPPTPLAAEIATYPVAMWGRGSVLGGPPAWLPAEYQQALGAVPSLNELGFGMDYAEGHLRMLFAVRTAGANPADVVAKIDRAEAAGALTPAAVEKIAAAHPDSPLATDVALGPYGLTAGTFGAGVVLGVLIPAFIAYVNP